jgi:3',5'-nucleoside bisphosphate phosphatase
MDLRCGIEINTVGWGEVHILGYGIRWQDAAFEAKLEEFRGRREVRIQRIVEDLRKHGIDITWEDVRSGSFETLGRPHVADALKRKGVVKTRQEAFNRFLVKGKPGWVESMGPSPLEAIALIRGTGGFCSLAHPGTFPEIGKLEEWTAAGLEGLEVHYGTHTPSDVVRWSEVAARWGLLKTGGSDYHGPGTGREKTLGVNMPDEDYGRFMERLSRC